MKQQVKEALKAMCWDGLVLQQDTSPCEAGSGMCGALAW